MRCHRGDANQPKKQQHQHEIIVNGLNADSQQYRNNDSLETRIQLMVKAYDT
jgi:hypothetical protein